MVPATTSLTGFSGETIWPLRQLRLLVIIGDANHSTRAWMNFMIVRSFSPYNDIIGRPGIKAIQAVPSTVHGMLEFPVEGGIVTIHSIVLIPTECTSVITSSAVSKEEKTPEHRLNIREGYSPVLQKKRGQAPERAKAIQAEVQKLVEAGIMREVYYHDWLSNPVMVKKHDGSWRMCVDFTDLNKACPQDCYPVPEIDWKVESLCGYPFKYFLDAYKGYHQIKLAEPDEEKTAFHTGQGVYCYTKMPFGLKNAGATYQRLMDKAFESQIGWNIEVYVDDLVVKRYTEAEMMRDIEETFRTLRKINMKLNPKKCSFGLAEGVFLRYVVTPEGIKPCPDKTAVVLQLPSPRTIKEVQSLNGKLAGLNRFLSKASEKSFAAIQNLKKCIKKSDFHWTAEAEQTFKQLKQHLSELPLLVAPKPKEELIIYLFATHGAISAVLMTERGANQTPIYFISRALQGPELNYTPMEKLVLSLVFAAKRLQRYFQAHPITVITDQPIKQIMSRPDMVGWLQKWSIMLGEHNITYRPRTSVKGQILADFLIEMPGENPQAASAAETQQESWTLFTDGSSCMDGSNNEAEYEALIAGLWIAVRMGVKNVHVSVDCKLGANQVLGTYVAKEDNMVKYLDKVKSLVSGFTTFSISQVSRSKNKKADAPSKIASTSFAHLFKQVLVEVLKNKSIKEKEVATVVEEDGPTWMTPIVEYLKEGTLPGDKKEARKLCLKARQYELMEGILYRHSFFTPWLRCVRPLQAEYVKREIHEGSCSMHAGPRTRESQIFDSCYGLLHEVDRSKSSGDNHGRSVSDNDKQFSDNPFKDWCDKLNISQRFASVKHPQSNGLVERANRSLGEGIKARLAIGMPTYRTTAVDVVSNGEELRLNLDLLEERRERAAICEAKAKAKMTKYYNARVHGVTFRTGDFVVSLIVLVKLASYTNDASHAVAGGKLGPKWEGPYKVTEALGDGAYKLRSMDGTILPRTWNMVNLKRCYL
nr:reverse transcriptase domain-containing protein [Tanacetum cinerariifolium]